MSAATSTALPDVVMVHAKINDEQANKLFINSGVEWLHDAGETTAKKAPSGKALFGKTGTKNVSLKRIWAYLRDNNYMVTYASLQRLPQDTLRRLTLRVVLTKESHAIVDAGTVQKLQQYLTEYAWGYLQVWDNPPTKAEKCVDTVHVGGRLNHARACELELDSNDGWHVAD